MNFLLISDDKYFHTIKESVRRINVIYPESSIYLYDWGFSKDNLEFLLSNYKNIIAIDWKENLQRIKSGNLFYFPNIKDEKMIFDLVLGFRNPFILKKLWERYKFFILKSNHTRNEVHKKWILENIYLEKIQCQMDMSRRIGDRRFVFLDADALLIDRIDEVFDNDSDFGFTLRRPSEINFNYNLCTVLNVGVVFFGRSQSRRDLFLKNWWKQALITEEWIREQTSLTRYLQKQDGFKFEYDSHFLISSEEGPLKISIFPCEKYNFNWIEELAYKTAVTRGIKVLHFKGARHNASSFEKLLIDIGV